MGLEEADNVRGPFPRRGSVPYWRRIMPAIARFYFRVADVAVALARVAELGFAPEEDGAPLADPIPPVVEGAGDVRAFLQPVTSQLDGLARFGDVVTPRTRQKWSQHLSYWTYHAWPEDEWTRAASRPIVERVETLCRVLGATELVCLSAARHPSELTADRLEPFVHAVGALDLARVFSKAALMP